MAEKLSEQEFTGQMEEKLKQVIMTVGEIRELALANTEFSLNETLENLQNVMGLLLEEIRRVNPHFQLQ